MELDRLLASNVALGIALIVLVALLLWSCRGLIRELADDPDPAWRWLLRWGWVPLASLLGWGALFDNWRQLIDEPLRLSKRFPSQRVVIDATPETLRAVTLVLLVISLIPLAALFARHIGGYAIQFVLLLGASILWAPLFALRRRLDFNLALGFGGDATSPLDVAGYTLFLALDWVTAGLVLLLTYTILTLVVALPLTLLLDLARLRQPRTTGEARDFFTAVASRASAIERERTLHPR